MDTLITLTLLGYLDPGSAGVILQILAAGFLGALFTIKLWWFKVKCFIFKIFGKDISSEAPVKDDIKPL